MAKSKGLSQTQRDEIDAILVDTYDDYEAMSSWEVAFSDAAEMPFRATLLGVAVEVVGFRVNNANAIQCEIIHEKRKRWVGVEDLDEEGLPEALLHVLTLYQAW